MTTPSTRPSRPVPVSWTRTTAVRTASGARRRAVRVAVTNSNYITTERAVDARGVVAPGPSGRRRRAAGRDHRDHARDPRSSPRSVVELALAVAARFDRFDRGSLGPLDDACAIVPGADGRIVGSTDETQEVSPGRDRRIPTGTAARGSRSGPGPGPGSRRRLPGRRVAGRRPNGPGVIGFERPGRSATDRHRSAPDRATASGSDRHARNADRHRDATDGSPHLSGRRVQATKELLGEVFPRANASPRGARIADVSRTES